MSTSGERWDARQRHSKYRSTTPCHATPPKGASNILITFALCHDGVARLTLIAHGLEAALGLCTPALFAALDVATGKVTDASCERHGKAELLDLMAARDTRSSLGPEYASTG